MSIMVFVVVLSTSVMVLASEAVESNMDSETYLATRMDQIDQAFEAGEITQEEADLLRAHIEEVALEGTFGKGPENGYKGDGNAECILGEDSNLGIFRSESAGARTGNGNGVGYQKADGTGNGGTGQGLQKGNRQGGQGNGSQRNRAEDCVVD